MIEYILNPQAIEALGWTLLHSIWQGAVFAILLVLILISLRRYSAQSRYIVSVGLLSAFFLTLSGIFWLQWQEASSQFELAEQQINIQPSNDIFALNNLEANVWHSDLERNNTATVNNEIVANKPSNLLTTFRNYYTRHLPLLVTIWFLGVSFLQLRFLGQLAYVQRLKHYGTQLFPTSWKDKIEELEGKLRIQKKVNYLTSIRIESPMVIGWLKPVVLMPAQLFNSLSETEIYGVLAHELAHIRREDFIVNLIQTFLCNVFFFHPGVWWMSNRIDEEREHCCDDLAVAATGPATSYAKTLINVSEFQLKGSTSLAMAFSGKNKKRERGGFSSRIRRLFIAKNGTGSFREGFTTVFILITALFLCIVATGSTVSITDSPTPPETILTENNSEILYNTESKQANKTTTTSTSVTTNTVVDAILNINQAIDLSELPVADPADPAALTEPVKPIDTRVDALVMACGESDFDFVKTLVISGIDVNGIGSEGFTPLMMAVNENDAEIVEYLIKQGADVNHSYDGWTALIEAADEGSLTSMKILLDAGAEVNYYSNQGSITAICMAASEGKLECLKLLLTSGADINGIGKSIPPLHLAANEGKREIIDYLISQNVNINKKDLSGRTALMYAASEGKKSSVKKLLDAGAEVNYYSNQDRITAISLAASEGKLECLKLLLTSGADINGIGKSIPPLHLAAHEGKREIIDYLISQNVNINKKDLLGRTALMYAASEGKKSSVKKLMEAGADILIVDLNGANAREYAENEDEFDKQDFLELKKKDVRGKHSDIYEEKSEFHKTTQDGYIEKIQHMVEQGTDVNTKDEYGRTPLHIASAEGHDIDMNVLIDLGADVNAQDDQGRTPLMYAAADGKKGASIFLVSRLADVNIKDVDGKRAFEWGISGGNSDLVKFLGLITENKNQAIENDSHKQTDDNRSTRRTDTNESQRESRINNRQKAQAKRIQKEIERDYKREIHQQKGEEKRLQKETEESTKIELQVQKENYKIVEKEVEKALEAEAEKRQWLHATNDGIHLRQFDMAENIPLLLETVQHGTVKDCAKLLSTGIPVNITDESGRTALMLAASTNRLDMATLLIEEGANVNLSSSSGLTALHYAALENHDKIAQLLLKNYAKVDAIMQYSSTDGNYSKEPLVWVYNGATPLLIAVETENAEMVAVLINAGANINHSLRRDEYRLNNDRDSYLSGNEVMGLNEDFLQEVEFHSSDNTWTPYKQALLLNEPKILAFFPR